MISCFVQVSDIRLYETTFIAEAAAVEVAL